MSKLGMLARYSHLHARPLTRLAEWQVHIHRLQAWLVLESSSASHGTATAHLPVIDLLRAYFQVQSQDDARRIRERVIGKLLTLDPALGTAIPAVLSLLAGA